MAKYKEIVIHVKIRPEAILSALIRDTLARNAGEKPQCPPGNREVR